MVKDGNGSVFDFYDDRFIGKWNIDDGSDLIVTIDKVGKDMVYNSGRKEEKVVLYMKDSKPMVLNKTNAKIITKLFGTDKWSKWSGRRIALYVDKSVRNPNPGELPGGIRVRPYEPKTEEIICADCGKPVQDAEIGGKIYKAKVIAENARTKFGRCLCAECAGKAKQEVENVSE